MSQEKKEDFHYIVKIYNGEYLIRNPSKVVKANSPKEPSPHVEIIINKDIRVGKTKIIKHSSFPVWNEEFEINTFQVFFIKIQVFHKTVLIGHKTINLNNFTFESVQKVVF